MTSYPFIINMLEAIMFTMVVCTNTPRDIKDIMNTHKDKYVLTYWQRKRHSRWFVGSLFYVISSIIVLRCLSTLYQDDIALSLYAISGGCIALFAYRNKRISYTIQHIYSEIAKRTYITDKTYRLMLTSNRDLEGTIMPWYVLCALQVVHTAIVLSYTI